RGQVLPVGGIKEKVLAASRAGLTTVILPRRNERDLEEVPAEVREKIRFVLVDRISQAFAAALTDGQNGDRPSVVPEEKDKKHSRKRTTKTRQPA
ncbi:MAG: endopeptidase La, partial [Anaerolineae bacterium]|nr:endopeptidase La [Anaerolineae bacterium]